ncbi:MAG TPA: glycosyltransferase family 39 protein, partial [Nitrospira sp.]
MRKSSLFHFGLTSTRRLFLLLVVIGFGLRMGYGAIRYRSKLTHLSGQSFVASWDHDALSHILIAKALLSNKGYIVDDSALPAGKAVRYPGQEALYKAPFYQFFLAGIFAISGLSFKLFFPLQALLGGFTAGFVGLIAWKVFRKLHAAWLAGILAATHPILVNSASQPYNENLFFFFYTASVLVFLIWFQTHQSKWALLCGMLAGMCTLTRENGTILLAAMASAILLTARHMPKVWVGCGVLLLTAIAVVAPWTIHNYVRFGVFLPVSSIVGVDFKEGNNDCVAHESLFSPYWAEGPCPLAEEQVRAQIESTVPQPR